MCDLVSFHDLITSAPGCRSLGGSEAGGDPSTEGSWFNRATNIVSFLMKGVSRAIWQVPELPTTAAPLSGIFPRDTRIHIAYISL